MFSYFRLKITLKISIEPEILDCQNRKRSSRVLLLYLHEGEVSDLLHTASNKQQQHCNNTTSIRGVE